jgi:hypothetical protein
VAPVNVLTLRGALQTLLSSKLGTYTLANGSTTPAISVRATGETLQPGTTVSGMEVVIVRDPEGEPVPQYTAVQAFDVWTVLIVKWGGAYELQTVRDLVLGAYPDTTFETPAVPEGVGPAAQLRCQIRTGPDAA